MQINEHKILFLETELDELNCHWIECLAADKAAKKIIHNLQVPPILRGSIFN